MTSSSLPPSDLRDSQRQFRAAAEITPHATIQPHDFGRTVLVVDDDDDTIDLTAAVLRRAGYQVAAAANGEEALTYLRRYPAPCLILLDLAMPIMDGWEFLNERQKNAAFNAIPVIVASGEWGVKGRTVAARVGFLPKPLERVSLLNAVRNVLDRG